MKKIILILIGVFFALSSVSSQAYIAGGIDPMQPGFRLSSGYLGYKWMAYGYGQCSRIGAYNYRGELVKFGGGLGIGLTGDNITNESYITLGVNHNKITDLVEDDRYDSSKVHDVSIDAGILVLVGKRDNIVLRANTDIINWGTCISVGYRF